MDSTRNTLFVISLATILSAVLFYFGTGLHPIWCLTWIAPVPVFVASVRLRFRWAWVPALVAWSCGALNVWHYDRALVMLPLSITLLSIFAPAAVFSVAALLFHYWVKRGSAWRAILIVPAVWVSYEYALASLSPHSTWGNLAYTQMDFLPIIQLASVTGIWGISFCLMLFASAVALLLTRGWRPFLAIAAVFLLAVMLFGWQRAHRLPVAPQLNVALLASDVPQNLIPKRSASLPVFEKYAAQIDRLASHGAQIVIIPEKAAVVDGASLAALDRILAGAASRNHVYVLAGVLRLPESYNESRLYSPDGRLRATYDKHHMVPQLEADERPGTRRAIIDQPSGKWGLTICKDMDFPNLSRQYGNDGAGLLLVPAWDFVADDWLHNRMAVLRGVESGFSIARSAKQGILSVSDNRGRILAERSSSFRPFTTLLASLPVLHETTLYDRWGDWFAWLNVAALAALLLIPLGATQSQKMRPVIVPLGWRSGSL